MTCTCCEKRIRGNAASERYNETRQVMEFVCKACSELFKRAEIMAYKEKYEGR